MRVARMMSPQRSVYSARVALMLLAHDPCARVQKTIAAGLVSASTLAVTYPNVLKLLGFIYDVLQHLACDQQAGC